MKTTKIAFNRWIVKETYIYTIEYHTSTTRKILPHALLEWTSRAIWKKKKNKPMSEGHVKYDFIYVTFKKWQYIEMEKR